MKVLVTGATGFVGRFLVRRLLADGDLVYTTYRTFSPDIKTLPAKWIQTDLSNISSAVIKSLEEVDVVVHLAARAHVMNETESSPLEAYRRVNLEASLDLANAANSCGVKRFIYISSIKVNGELTAEDVRFKADDPVNPQDPYGQSKHDAEIALCQLSKETGLEVVIIRPPMVYGQGVKGNMCSLMKLVSIGLPLPLGGIKNARSLVAVDNLVSLIKVAMTHPKAANETFLVSDGEDLSTSDLVSKITLGLRKSTLLLPIPVSLSSKLLKLVGKGAIADRLFGSLRVDITKTKQLLDWEPPISVQEGIKRMCQGHQNE